MTELGYYRILDEMKKGQKEEGSNAEKEVEALRKALELATMKVAALETLIDVAEDRHNIDIRKKIGSKQSKYCGSFILAGVWRTSVNCLEKAVRPIIKAYKKEIVG